MQLLTLRVWQIVEISQSLQNVLSLHLSQLLVSTPLCLQTYPQQEIIAEWSVKLAGQMDMLLTCTHLAHMMEGGANMDYFMVSFLPGVTNNNYKIFIIPIVSLSELGSVRS